VLASLDWPLMSNNISPADLKKLCRFLEKSPKLTQSVQVQLFEREWSRWLGVKYSIFVNSGSSANLITLAALREAVGPGEVIVPALTWVSDIASVLQNGFKPVFADIDPRTLGMNPHEILSKVTARTKAVFLTHILGLNALTGKLAAELRRKKIVLIEDVCESHGARLKGRKLGTFGLASNFSFYYAHHMSTIEGGMVCTNSKRFYETCRALRAHGLVREMEDAGIKRKYARLFPDLNPDFIFAFPAYNVRSTEINALLGRIQLKRLDAQIKKRNANFKLFLNGLDAEIFQTDFEIEGMSNYALLLILKPGYEKLSKKIAALLKFAGVEARRGLSGGGNQLRQPYLRKLYGEAYKKYPRVEHVHFNAFYIGNYPALDRRKIKALCGLLNAVGA